MKIDASVVREEIQKLLRECGREAGALKDDQSLFISGLLDSISLLRFVTWLENNFDFQPDGTFNAEKLDTVQRIVQTVLGSSRP